MQGAAPPPFAPLWNGLLDGMCEGYALQEILLDDAGHPCDTRFLQVNAAFERLTGLGRAQVVGRRASEAAPPSPLWGPRFAPVALGGQPFPRQEATDPSTGLTFELSAHSPAPGQFAVLFLDITPRQAALEELDAFAYTVSHDLRAPLRHIQGFGELLQAELPEPLPGRATHFLATLLASAHRMDRLMDGLLAFSRCGRAPLQRRPLDLNTLVRDVLHALAPDFQGRQVNMEVSPLPAVDADPALLASVFTHLLANALKFTRLREEAHITLTWEDLGREWAFTITDNGAGFNPRHASRLFGVLQRLHPPEPFEGSGVGLAQVRRIIQRHGGRVWAVGEVDHGAAFTFTLPAHRA